MRVWRGHYCLYVYRPDGTKERKHKTVRLGLKAEMKKWEAQSKLRSIIEREYAKIGLAAVDVDPTFEWFWRERYLPIREGIWSRNTRSAVGSVIEKQVLPVIGRLRLDQITRFTLQSHLNDVANRFSRSVAKKVRVYVTDMLEEAFEQDLIAKNPARKLDMPRTRRPCERYLTADEVRKLLAKLQGRDHLIMRMFILCALRPGELFALRRECVEPGRLRVKEGVTRGVVQETKTRESNGFVALPTSLEAELGEWLARAPSSSERAFIFAGEQGRPLDAQNYLKRVLKPAAAKAGIMGVTFQSLRRTFATLIQGMGTVKDAQAQLRHVDAQTTMNIYQKAIPASVSAAVEALDQKLSESPREAEPTKPAEPQPQPDGTEYPTPNQKGPKVTAQLLHNFFGRRNQPVNRSRFATRTWVVRPSGFEPPTFCSGAIGTSSYPSYCYLGFQPLGASAFAQLTSSEGSTPTVLIRF